MSRTLFDKIWDSHVVQRVAGGSDQLYIDRLYCHEVTSPQAFEGLRLRGLGVFRPSRVVCMPDHNIPTCRQECGISDPVAFRQVEALKRNASDFGLLHFGVMDSRSGIVHVVGPERGLTLPGMTVVCGDSHTSTHGAMGCVAFGIGTSEVEMVLASGCILQSRPKTMRIQVEGALGRGVSAKDMALYIISRLGTGGATGHFIEYSGSAVRGLSLEGRLTLCNLSIEMGARGGIIAPDEKTFAYLKGAPDAPKGGEWERKVAFWRTLRSDEDAHFDKETSFDASEIPPMVTYGTNPGMGIGIDGVVPEGSSPAFRDALEYMGFTPGERLLGKRVDYVFVGACTNGRVEDFREFASIVRGRRRAPGVVVWLVPGSWEVRRRLEEEGIVRELEEAGFELRQPGCSACLGMNEDRVPAGKLCVSTSNRNFVGRQGPGSRTILTSPLTAAAAAVKGVIADPREFLP